MTILVVSPGVAWAIADVYAGLVSGLMAQSGVTVVPHDLTAGEPIAEAAARVRAGAVIVVSGILVHPSEIDAVRASGVPVYVLFTETPYDLEQELALAARVDGGWTHERTALSAFQAVNPQMAYLPHAYRPDVHRPDGPRGRAHDVVFVGSGFPERVTFFNAIDWTGIDLGLYGIWEGFGLKESLTSCIHAGPIDNATAASLYRAAKVGLNLYRRTKAPAESLNPRAYELAACGTLIVSEDRAEHCERLSDRFTFTVASGAAHAIRRALAVSDAWRPTLIDAQRRLLAPDTWSSRACDVVQHLATWTPRARPAGAVAPFTGPRRPWMEAA